MPKNQNLAPSNLPPPPVKMHRISEIRNKCAAENDGPSARVPLFFVDENKGVVSPSPPKMALMPLLSIYQQREAQL